MASRDGRAGSKKRLEPMKMGVRARGQCFTAERPASWDSELWPTRTGLQLSGESTYLGLGQIEHRAQIEHRGYLPCPRLT